MAGVLLFMTVFQAQLAEFAALSTLFLASEWPSFLVK